MSAPVEPVSIASLMQRSPPSQPQYNWVGVLEFLHEQHKSLQYKECEWALEKSQMSSKINELEGIIKGLERVVGDLGKRAKMLEVALRQERLKHQSGGQGPDVVGQLMKENIDNQSQIQNLQTIPKRKAKPYRPLLQKILQEVGISSIFSPPSSPKIETSNRPSVMLTPNQNVSQIAQNSGRQSPTNMNSTSGFPTHSRSKSQNITIDESQIKEPIQLVTTLRNHLDGVREVFFFNNIPVLASVSEDCQIKLWDLQNLNQPQIEPYLTLREHTGPIFSITGIEGNPKGRANNQKMIFSGGNEGVIKVWNFPMSEEFDQFGPTEQYQQCLNSWQAHQDAIWQLTASPLQNFLLSAGADGIIKLWSVQDVLGEPRQVQTYGQRNQYGHMVDSPTAVSWLQFSQGHFASGFAGAPNLCVFDTETGRMQMQIKYGNDSNAQINDITCHPSQPQLIAAHDDGKVRIFDLQSQKVISQFAAGNDPATSATINQSGTVIYVSSGTWLKAWDIRRQQFLQETQPHQPKYDECIHKLVHHQQQNLFASCGADGVIKLFASKYS